MTSFTVEVLEGGVIANAVEEHQTLVEARRSAIRAAISIIEDALMTQNEVTASCHIYAHDTCQLTGFKIVTKLSPALSTVRSK